MKFYENQHLADLRTLQYELTDDEQLVRFVDDLGTLAASLFGGVRLDQKLTFILAGVLDQKRIFDRVITQLPYRIETKGYLTNDICAVTPAIDGDEVAAYIDLATVARAFTESEPCESLPVKNAASP